MDMKKRTKRATTALLLILVMLFYSFALPKTASAQDFGYTGGIQSFTAPVAGNYQLEVWGAQGGGGIVGGGKGGYSVGGIVLAQGETLYLYVGSNTGYNGGGAATYNGGSWGQPGGGASDIRRYGQDLNSRVIVAGGGGAGCSDEWWGPPGAPGGGGNGGYNSSGYGGATQYSGGLGDTSFGGAAQSGSFGQGGSGYMAGGGGWYGGGSGGYRMSRGESQFSCGGGGSGYIGGVLLGSMQTGMQTGNGYARITKVANTPYPTVQSWGFNYTGTYQTYTAQFAGTYRLDVSGAQGGSHTGAGGYGGTSSGTIWLAANQTIYLYVGGIGRTPDLVNYGCIGVSGGGFNGGGNTTILNANMSGPPAGTIAGAGGGGASDVRTALPIPVASQWVPDGYGDYIYIPGNDGTPISLTTRLIVGGGGGGGGSASNYGGAGGGSNGGDASYVATVDMWQHVLHNYTGRGASQSAGGVGADGGYWPVDGTIAGTFGVGSNAAQISFANTGWYNGGGGGGGGWYGGSAGAGGGFFGGGAAPAGGGGGSGYIGGVSGGTMTVGDHGGNGYIKITKVNTLPNGPIITSPINGETLMSQHSPTVTWNFSDPDVGDYQKYYQVVASNDNWATWYYDSDVVTSGSNSMTIPNLPDGNWKIAVRTWDQQGTSTPPWGFSNFTIVSNRLPNPPIITSPTNGQALATHTPTITWTFSDPDVGDYQKSYQVVGSKDNWATWYYNSGVVQSGSNSITATYLPDGNWQFAVRTWDQTDMDTPPFGYRSFVITGDTIPPTVGNGMDVAIRYTNAADGTMMRFNTTNGADTGGSGYEATYFWCTKDLVTNAWFLTQQRGTAWGTNNWYVDVPIQGEGTYLTRAYPRDNSGNFNWSSSVDEKYIVDRQVPNAPTIMLSRQGLGNTDVSLSLISNGDNGDAGNASMQISMDGGSWLTYTGAWTNGEPWGLPVDGLHTVSAKAIDNAGNVSATSTTTYGTDSTSPNLTLTPNTTAPDSVVTITATATDGASGVSRIQLPSGASVNGASATYQATSNGTYTFIAWDIAGNQSTKSIIISNINTIPIIPSINNPVIFDSPEEAARAGYYPDPQFK